MNTPSGSVGVSGSGKRQASRQAAPAVAGPHRLVFAAPLATWKSTPSPFPSSKASGTNLTLPLGLFIPLDLDE